MATTFVNTSYVSKNVPTTGATITTVGASNTIAITSMVVANTSSSPITTDVYFTRSATDYYLVKGATVAVGGSLEVIGGNRVTLIASDVLKVVASANSSADCVTSVLVAY